ncbi:MAG: PAS domain S-box protein [Spirochaetes bacterium]|nr:MAG: PAS domain S-box protein [Spirochaetota bacterium]
MEEDMQKTRVLIVDDELIIGNSIASILQNRGYETAGPVPSGRRALELIAGERPDVVLMDLHLEGDLDGVETTALINERFGIPVVFVTAYSDDATLARLNKVISYGYVMKPFQGSEIISNIELALVKHQMEIRLSESESKYRTLFENSKDAIYIRRIDGSLLDFNKSTLELFGYSREEFSAMNAADVYVNKEDRIRLQEILLQNGFVKDFEISLRRKDGSILSCLVTSTLLRDAHGNPAFIQGSLRDITERKALESALQQSLSKFQTFFDNIIDPVYIHDLGGKIVEVNAAAYKQLGYEKDELLGSSISALTAPESAGLVELQLKELGEEGRSKFESIHIAKDGRRIPMEVNTRIIDYHGRPMAMRISHDITEREYAMGQVKTTHAEIAHILNAITSILIGVSLKDVVTHWNPAAAAAFDLPKAAVIGWKFGEIQIDWDWGRVYEGISDCILQERSVRLKDLTFKDRAGNARILGVTISPIKDANDLLRGFIIFGADITDRRIMESQLAHAQKMESIGQLAAGIAHEINSPLQYIRDNLSFLRDSFGDLMKIFGAYDQMEKTLSGMPGCAGDADSARASIAHIDRAYVSAEIPKAVQESIDGIERVVSIIKSMKEFSHPGTTEKTMTDINRSIESTVTISRNEWKYIADLETDLEPGLPAVPLIAGEFNQVLLNIIINAAHAIEEKAGNGGAGKGTIRITTRRAGGEVEIRISDTGAGIPESIRSKVFDPFFTTKEVGKGTGQGLSIAYAVVVKKHGGTLTFDSEKGKGTTFVIRMPIS